MDMKQIEVADGYEASLRFHYDGLYAKCGYPSNRLILLGLVMISVPFH